MKRVVLFYINLFCLSTLCYLSTGQVAAWPIELRLVGGLGPHEGRVEVKKGDNWGTVCDDSWDDRDAQIVCRQLGFVTNGAVAKRNAMFGQGDGTIMLDDVNCSGTELSLAMCEFNTKHNCNHAEDASVICSWPAELRLVGGSGPHQGRVEVNRGGNWGTICDDSWDDKDAEVVCRHLGIRTNGAVAKGNAKFGEGEGTIMLDEVKCNGTESTLAMCEFITKHNCKHSEDASVTCNWSIELRLVGGSGPHEGRVEVKWGDNWGTVCDDFWDSKDAAVVCRHLGFITNDAVAKHGAYFGQGTGTIMIDDVSCVGNERSLSVCPYITNHNCGHNEDASVICEPAAFTTTPSVETTIESEGPRSKYRFYCRFNTLTANQNLLFTAYWYIDDLNRYRSERVEYNNDTARSLTESTLRDLGITTVGFHIACGISAGFGFNSKGSSISKSKRKFIGIEISNTTMNIVQGKPGFIYFRPTVPIGCPRGNCKYGLTAMIPQPEDKCSATVVSEQSCGVTIQYRDWTKTHKIKVTGTIPSRYEISSRKMEVILTGPSSYAYHEIWSNYVLPPVYVYLSTDTTPIEHKRCSTYSGFSVRTFDTRYYEIQMTGIFIMYRNQERNIEIQVKTFRCDTSGSAYCNCAVVVRVGRTFFMVSHCSSAFWFADYTLCEDGGELFDIKKSISSYKIKLPTGTIIRLTLRTSTTQKLNYIDVYIYPSIVDVGATSGLCGNFNGDSSDDQILRNGDKSPDIPSLARDWSPSEGEDLFQPNNIENVSGWDNTYQICRCNQMMPDNGQLTPLNDIDCSADASAITCLEDPSYTPVHKKRCLQPLRKKRSLPDFTSQIIETRRIKRDVTKINATDFCQKLFDNSAMAKQCRLVPGININSDIDVCVKDIELSGSTNFAMSGINGLRSDCLRETQMNRTLQETDVDSGRKSVFEMEREVACLSDCNQHGRCDNGSCVCNEGFIGNDCSVEGSNSPMTYELEALGYCDILEDGCQEIAVFGGIFVETAMPTCRLVAVKVKQSGITTIKDAETVTAVVESIGEVTCPLPREIQKRSPVVPVIDEAVTGYRVSVSNNDVDYSEELTMVIINSECMRCNITGQTAQCSFLPNYCSVNNQCYKDGALFSLNPEYICRANSGMRQWEKVGNADSKSTIFIVIITLSVCGIAVLGVILICFSKCICKRKRTVRNFKDVKNEDVNIYS